MDRKDQRECVFCIQNVSDDTAGVGHLRVEAVLACESIKIVVVVCFALFLHLHPWVFAIPNQRKMLMPRG